MCILRGMTHEQILRNAGKADDIAALCGVASMTVRSWIFRDRIPGEYWAILARAGHATLDQLANAAEKAA